LDPLAPTGAGCSILFPNLKICVVHNSLQEELMKKLLKIFAALSVSSAILVGQVLAQSETVLKYMA
jgi:hypothetical protein